MAIRTETAPLALGQLAEVEGEVRSFRRIEQVALAAKVAVVVAVTWESALLANPSG